jgi:glycosyltransferase involved in cell wall biosynthesis
MDVSLRGGSYVAEQATARPGPKPTVPDSARATSVAPLVSVIIPAYNAERFVARTLESVLSQTYTNIQVLVVNDGSTDGTVKIVESYAQKDSRIRILHQPNLGAPAARNCAIKSCEGEYIAPVDADDIWHKEKIQAQIECFLHSSPSVGLVYSWSKIIDENDNPLTGIAHEYRGNVLAELIYSNFVGNGSSPMIRRSCFQTVGDFNLHLQGGQDWDMYLRFAERYQFQVIPKYHVGYRRVLNSISADYENQDRCMATVVDNFEEGHPGVPKTLFRLSRSYTSFYMAGRASEAGQYMASLGYLLRCLKLDPVRIVSSEYFLAMLKLFVRLTAKPLVSILWKDPMVWEKLRRPLSSSSGRATVVWDEMSARRRPRLFDKIHNWRMARLKHRIVGGGL